MALPDYREIASALTGSWRLARRDTAGYGDFNVTAEGFWRSFAAIILIAPVFFAVSAIERTLLPETGMGAPEASGGYLAARAVALIVDWAAFPIVMALVARAMDLGGRYALFIIAYNWSSVLAIAFLSPPFLLHGVGLISGGATAGISMILTLLVIYYRWFIARTALELSGVMAAGIVVLDLVLSIVISVIAGRLFTAPV